MCSLMPFLILVVSAALFLFYVQTTCARTMRREFDRAFYQDVINAIHLEYPRLQDAILSRSALAYSDARHALRCDFMTLEYILKNADSSERYLSPREKILLLYFRFLLFCLPIRHALKHGENEAVLKLTTILQFLANLVGEKLTVSLVGDSLPNPQS